MHSKLIAISLVSALVLAMAPGGADARAVRVDSGDWDSSGFLTAGSSQSIGFNIDFLGISTSTAMISENGGISLSGGGESASINAFGDLNQSGGGNTAQYQFATTNGNFNQAGVDAGFRISWQVLDSGGALLNEYQLSLFSMSNGQLALEFNYNQLLFGDDSSQVGYSTSLGDSLDLLDVLGLNFADASGIGDDFTNNCAGTPDALACNNYYDGTYGPGLGVLPEIANGFFRLIDSNGDPVQGRALFLFGAAQIPEPGTIALLLTGFALLLLSRRRRAALAALPTA
ncbi:MAG: PEP-CTERM sorting domain-containing protein [Pseudomonadota bacterium]